jgi:hypothetical protein
MSIVITGAPKFQKLSEAELARLPLKMQHSCPERGRQ